MHYFSRMTLTPEGIGRQVIERSRGAYSIHKQVWSLFPNSGDKERDYIYSVLDDGRTIYCVSATVPVCEDGSWVVETKPYEPIIMEGQVLRFRLCANPTVANSNTGKHQRHDVVMDMKRKIRGSGEYVPMDDIIHSSVSKWFSRKGELNGFEPLEQELMVHSYVRNESYKAGVQKIVFSSVVLEGLIRVTNVEMFRSALFNGIGAAKGFGCGMMMVKVP